MALLTDAAAQLLWPEGLEIQEKLGAGAFGSVFKCQSSHTGEVVAVKLCRSANMAPDGKTPREAHVIQRLGSHKHLVSLKGWQKLQSTGFGKSLVLHAFHFECFESDLANLIDKYISRMVRVPEEFLWSAFEEVSSALAYCHHGIREPTDKPRQRWNPVVHLDVKPANVFLRFRNNGSRDPWPICVLGDFGIAQQEKKYVAQQTPIGTPSFRAPEVKLSPKRDIWSLAATIKAAALRVQQAPERQKSVFPLYSRDLDQVIRGAQVVDPRARWSSKDLYLYLVVTGRAKQEELIYEKDLEDSCTALEGLHLD